MMMYKCNFCIKSSSRGICEAGLYEKEIRCTQAIETMEKISGNVESLLEFMEMKERISNG